MSFPTASPKLQAEFLRFLEQRLSNVESQLSISEKEREQLRATLTQTEKKLEVSDAALRELRRNAAAIAEAPHKPGDVAVRNELERMSRPLSEEEAVSRERLPGVFAHLQDSGQVLNETIEEMQSTDILLARLRTEMVDVEKARAEALADRDTAIAAEKECRQQLKTVTAELAAAKKTSLTLSSIPNSGQAGTSSDLKYDGGKAEFVEFNDKMRALPGPNQIIDLSSLVPVSLKTLSDQSRLEELYLSDVLNTEDVMIFEGQTIVWLPGSCHALQVGPMYQYDNRARVDNKWSVGPRIRSMGTVEFFHSYMSEIYYVGTYRAVEGPQDVRLTDIGDTSFVRSPADGFATLLAVKTASLVPERNHVAMTLPEMYRKGVMRLQVTGLQCVGFNHRLDAELHRKSLPPDEALPDNVPEASGSTSKRKRTSLSPNDDSDLGQGTDEPARKEARVAM
ncbi:uncharacterized protein B0H18DRAFT_1039627 [Fomitopsis serialis]|uniref:uncharacterized protein n=1 Tax=Fomitopsis serialis TaxID=139415 RepID=UPI0020076CB2|nr:uncharacterized protein B0H18DRAFT_1039627 [Neoantrodia serialis]KAH9915897.1 hypothetical protein B0H18DRAFT_1039627 [Neoantrodia serialis]